MKTYPLLLSWLLVLTMVSFAQTNDTERTVVKVQETEREKRTITEVFKGDKLIRKHVEAVRAGEKPVVVKYTRYYQDGKEVLFESWDSRSKVTIRYFMAETRLVMAETDYDGDGWFEWVVLYGDGGNVEAVFKRTRNGGIEVLEEDALATWKEGSNLARGIMGELFKER